MSNLYENIKELCDEKGVKPGKMCTEASVSKGLITDLKMGRKKTVHVETAQKIADYFGVTVDRVLGAEKKNEPAEIGEPIPKYEQLNDENKVKAQEYIALLLRSRQSD